MLKAQLYLDPKPIPHCWPENIGNPVFLAISTLFHRDYHINLSLHEWQIPANIGTLKKN